MADDEAEDFFGAVQAEMAITQLRQAVSDLSPVELARAGIIVKKVQSLKNDFRRFGIDAIDSTTVVVEITLQYDDDGAAEAE